MKFFMIEWWSQEHGKYNQEYFQSMERASERFIMLRDMFPDSAPEISTCVMNDQTKKEIKMNKFVMALLGRVVYFALGFVVCATGFVLFSL